MGMNARYDLWYAPRHGNPNRGHVDYGMQPRFKQRAKGEPSRFTCQMVLFPMQWQEGGSKLYRKNALCP